MARGTTFGAYHSNRDLHLIQQQLEIGAAIPNINIVDVPGSDGGADLTEAIGIGVTYQPRELKWTFAPYPGADFQQMLHNVQSKLEGRRMNIILDSDPEWYYDGRVYVSEIGSVAPERHIIVTAICKPYRYKRESSYNNTQVNTTGKTVTLNVGQAYTIPEVASTVPVQITFGGKVINITQTNTFLRVPALYMAGRNSLSVKSTSGTGTINFNWREGAL